MAKGSRDKLLLSRHAALLAEGDAALDFPARRRHLETTSAVKQVN
jgi:hypothetical protein